MAYSMLLVFILCVGPMWTLPSFVNIGGIFDSDDRSLEKAFLEAITSINNDGSILPNGTRLVPQIKRIEAYNSFQASEAVCQMMTNGVAAIFGPQSDDSCVHVQSVCDTMSVPHFATRWNCNTEQHSLYSLNLFPHGPTLGKAYMNLVRTWNWRSFALIYQDNEGLMRLKDLFNTPDRSPLNIMAVQLPVSGNYHETFSRIMKAEHVNIVVDCDLELISRVLQQLQQIGMMTDRYHYFITSLDVETVNLDEFSYSGTTITSLRLVDQSQTNVKGALKSMRTFEKSVEPSGSNIDKLKTEAALMFDAVYIFAYGLKRLDDVTKPDIKPLDCQSDEKWEDGETLFNYLNQVIFHDGLSGRVTFNSKGDRTQFELDVTELQSTGMKNIGVWNSSLMDTKVEMSPAKQKLPIAVKKGTLSNKFLNVAMLMIDPYIMLKNTSEHLVGNDRFEGFCVDILKEISRELGFNYSLYEVADKKHGARRNSNNSWDGLIGEVLMGRADLAISDITITAERKSVVDFSTPFMNTGIGILYLAPTQALMNSMSFLSPFSNTLWFLIGITYIGLSIILFIVARLTPYEWRNPYPCIRDPDEVPNRFTLLNSMWFTIGSLMQQSSDMAPKASSTRTIAGFWWFFTVIILASYTANLMALLTSADLETPIKNAKDLEAQTKIKYGCMENGATRAFFRRSQVSLYQRMRLAMESAQPSAYVFSNAEGIERVKRGNYAFLMEFTSSEYIVERDCDLTQIGGLLDAKGYGIAMQRNSPYRDEISKSILHLQDKGILAHLKLKWWKHKKSLGHCTSDSKLPKPLVLSYFGGLSMVVIGGVFLAILIAIFEFWWKTRQIPRHERKSICGEMLNELMSAVCCKETKTMVKRIEEPSMTFEIEDEPHSS